MTEGLYSQSSDREWKQAQMPPLEANNEDDTLLSEAEMPKLETTKSDSTGRPGVPASVLFATLTQLAGPMNLGLMVRASSTAMPVEQKSQAVVSADATGLFGQSSEVDISGSGKETSSLDHEIPAFSVDPLRTSVTVRGAPGVLDISPGSRSGKIENRQRANGKLTATDKEINQSPGTVPGDSRVTSQQSEGQLSDSEGSNSEWVNNSRELGETEHFREKKGIVSEQTIQVPRIVSPSALNLTGEQRDNVLDSSSMASGLPSDATSLRAPVLAKKLANITADKVELEFHVFQPSSDQNQSSEVSTKLFSFNPFAHQRAVESHSQERDSDRPKDDQWLAEMRRRLVHVQPVTRTSTERILERFGPEGENVIKEIYCLTDATHPGDHPHGLATDFMVELDSKAGREIAEWAMENSDSLGVKYIIWSQRIWNPDIDGSKKPWSEWRLMKDRGDPTQNHRDHPHISFKA